MSSTPEAIRSQILDLVRQYHTAKFAPKVFDPDKDLVHYAGRVFDAEEIVNLVDAGLDFYLTANRYAERFESEFADYLGLSNAMLVNSGSSANLVALTTLTSPKLKDRRLNPGDEVITTACGFPTTLNPILQNQLVPVFVDVNLGDYTAIPERLAAAIGPKTKAVMMAHTMGVPFHLDVIMDIVKKHNLWLIEDTYPAPGHSWSRFFRNQEKLKESRVENDLSATLKGVDAVVLAVRHEAYMTLDPDEVIKMTGHPVAVIDYFGILDDEKIKRYFELGCEVKGLGRGHVKRIKDSVQAQR